MHKIPQLLNVSKKIFFTFIFLGLCSSSFAQVSVNNWPSHPINLVVPFTAGSATDVLARVFAEKLGAKLGQPIIVDNRVGAGGTIGTSIVAKSAPDGYTLLVVSAGHVVNPVLYSKLNYQLKDLAAISPLGTQPNVLVVSPKSGIKSVKELVERANSSPNGLTFGSAGVGSATHTNAEKFVHGLKLKATHIPYKGTPQMLMDVTGSNVDFAFGPVISALSLIRDGKITALAVSSEKRISALPNVPTATEAGFPQGQFNFWIGMLAPAQTPKPIIDRLNKEIQSIMDQPDVVERFDNLGALAFKLTAPEFDHFIIEESKTLGEVMKKAGVTLD
jgi:tripartite-type tricarboxylate transporter receptor subunit TctC